MSVSPAHTLIEDPAKQDVQDLELGKVELKDSTAVSVTEPKTSEYHSPSTDFGFIPIPKRLRYNPETPFEFTFLLNISFGFASTFTVANLYYCQPLLIEYSNTFNVSYDVVSRIPTLIQAGYAVGLVLISPLGDIVRRRQLVMLLVFIGTTLTIGLAVTKSYAAFEAICFLVGVATVTPQILMPLAADLAPPERRASAISLVLSGLMLGVLIARVIAGVIGNFTSWRVVYYLAIGVQSLVLFGAWALFPDYPSKNKNVSYFKILYTMAKYAVTEPLLIQASLINIASSACFTNFWTTLTFLLGGQPYYYNTLDIGLFGLLGMLGVFVGPFMGRFIDRLVPWYATLVATILLAIFQAIQTGAGGINVGAVIVACFGLDVFRQTQQVSLSARVLGLDPAARARMNAILILSIFIGQVMGTSVGTEVFVEHGWRASAGMALAWTGFQLLVLALRGPHCPRYRWFGYEGGWESRKSIIEERARKAQTEVNAEAEKHDIMDIKTSAESQSGAIEESPREKDPSRNA